MKTIVVKKCIRTLLATSIGLIILSACDQADREPAAELVEQGRALSDQFVATLQPTLQAAMQEGGPVRGIEVCAEEAPRIAADLSQASGWDVSRVSLRARNQSSATPDSWEAEVLASFDLRQADGEAVEHLNAAAIVGEEFRYMQAQAAGPLCLACHGTQISSDVQSVLSQHYPHDMATGYTAGQIRGAISLRKALD